MTYHQLLAKLRQTPREWQIEDGMIRLGRACPITALSPYPGHQSAVWAIEVAEALGISRAVRTRIVKAADGGVGPLNRLCRADLLNACGLAKESVR